MDSFLITTLAFCHHAPVKRLQPPDTFHLDAAIGWLGLGNHLEANEELEKITPGLRAYPDVLEVRIEIYARAKRWEGCVEIANALVLIRADYSLVVKPNSIEVPRKSKFITVGAGKGF